MLWISVDDLVAPDVAHVVHQDLVAEHVNQSLNCLGHLFGFYGLILVLKQMRKIEFGVGHGEALDVEGVLEENSDVLKGFGLVEVAPDFVSNDQDSFNDFLLVGLVLFLALCELV